MLSLHEHSEDVDQKGRSLPGCEDGMIYLISFIEFSIINT